MKKREDGRYQKAVTIQVDGKPVRKYFYGTSIADINRQIMQSNSEVERGKFFKDIAEEWYEEHETRTTYNGHVAYKKPLHDAIETFGKKRIGEITTEHIQKYVNSYANQCYSKRTVQMYRGCIDLIFKYAKQHGYVSVNPVADSTIPQNLKTTKREIPSRDAIEIIKNYDAWLFPKFLLYTGLRRGEALAITDKDIDRKNRKIYVTKSVYFCHNKGKIKTPKTDAGVRTVPLLNALEIPKFNGYLFGEKEPYTEQKFRRAWEKFEKDTGLNITPHQLRHLFATILYEANVDEFATTRILGHSSIKITRDIYTRLREEKLKEVTDTIDAYIDTKI